MVAMVHDNTATNCFFAAHELSSTSESQLDYLHSKMGCSKRRCSTQKTTSRTKPITCCPESHNCGGCLDEAFFCVSLNSLSCSFILVCQADRRALNITLNSIGTELTFDDRRKLYSNFGLLYPHGQQELSLAADFEQVRTAMEKCPAYIPIFSKVSHSGDQQILLVSANQQ